MPESVSAEAVRVQSPATSPGIWWGEFPHKKISGEAVESYITTGSNVPMRRVDRTGRVCHWILEVHLLEPGRRFGGFYEELLDLP